MRHAVTAARTARRSLATAAAATPDSAAAAARMTLFKRPLNPPAVALSSPAGRAAFAAALASGGAEVFFPTIAHYATQDEPAFCGLASLAMALNALAVDPRRADPRKGPWRYYTEALLDCCLPLSRVQRDGITLDQAACLARCNGADVVVKRPPPVPPADGDGDDAATAAAVAASLAAFRADVAASASGTGGVVIVSYSRAAVAQTGDGHFSVVGAYDRGKGGGAAPASASDEKVLILDTARFKYPPHFLPLPLLHAAMRAPDSVTGAPRGWLVLQRAAVASVLFSLAGDGAAAATAAAREWGEGGGVGAALAGAAGADAAAALTAVAAAAPAASVAALVTVRAAALGQSGAPPSGAACTTTTPCAPTDAAATLLAEVRGTPAAAAVAAGVAAAHPAPDACAAHAAAAADGGGLLAERVALFLAALPDGAWAARPDVGALVRPKPGSVLETEVEYLARQWASLPALADADAAAAGGCGCGERAA